MLGVAARRMLSNFSVLGRRTPFSDNSAFGEGAQGSSEQRGVSTLSMEHVGHPLKRSFCPLVQSYLKPYNQANFILARNQFSSENRLFYLNYDWEKSANDGVRLGCILKSLGLQSYRSFS